MMPWKKAAVLLTSFSLLTACDTKRIATALPIPAERMDCAFTALRPALPAEHEIDWSKVVSVPLAKQEHDRFVASLRTRESKVTDYILDLEGKYFLCASDATWLREWQDGLTR
jgi:hypothetical protein